MKDCKKRRGFLWSAPLTAVRRLVKILSGVVVLWTAVFVWSGQALAAESPAAVDASEPDWQSELDSYDFGELQQVIDEALGQDTVSFYQVVSRLAEGNVSEFFDLLGEYVREVLWGELSVGQKTAWQILLLSVVGAVFTNLAQAFPDSQISQTGFYVMYMVLGVLLLAAFAAVAEVAAGVMAVMGRLLEAFLPIFFLAVAVQGQLTAAAMYEFTLVLIRGIQWLFEHVVLTGVRFFVVLRIMEGLLTEEMLSRLTGLLENGLKWLVKTAFGLAVGFQAVQALLLPYMDSVKGGTLMKLAQAIPGVGNGVETAAQLVLGTAALVRNGIGMAGVAVLLLVSLGPLIKLAFFAVLYHGLAAALQPVSDKRLLQAVAAMGDGSLMLFKTFTAGLILFAIAIGIACACFGRVG